MAIDAEELRRLQAGGLGSIIGSILHRNLPEILEALEDRERLEFIFRTLNAERAYGDWNEFHETGLSKTQREATYTEWRIAIDKARSKA